jgi:catechol 2,3-dioxygenase-like lactoylglutathione lyase family enzyme
VAILVHDTERALAYFRDHLGLEVKAVDEPGTPPVRLTYLDCGNAWLQLVEPLDPEHPLASQPEGLHHLCFGADDPLAAAAELARPGAPEVTRGRGRGRAAAFVPGDVELGTRVELTEFRPAEDVGSIT